MGNFLYVLLQEKIIVILHKVNIADGENNT